MHSSTPLAWLLNNLIFIFYNFVLFTVAQENILRITSSANTFTTSVGRLPTGVDVLCSIEASSLPNVSWYLNDTLIQSNSSTTRTVSTSPDDVIRLEETLNATQEGIYHCRATVARGSLRSPDYVVRIFDVPDFTTPLPPTNNSALVLPIGWSVILPCVENLQSYFSVSWWFNGGLLTSDNTHYISYSGNLNIYIARNNFTGLYHCSVVNSITQENFTGPSLHLTVATIQLPVYNNITPHQASEVVHVDQGAVINLEYNRYYEPIYNISWGPNVTSQPSMAPHLNVTNSSNYTAVIFLNEQQSRAVTIQVRINSAPFVQLNTSNTHYVCPGDSLTLSCTVYNSSPSLTAVTWFHDGARVAGGDSLTLTHSSTLPGYYQCYAENDVGAAYDYTLLTIFPIPSISIEGNTSLILPYGFPLSLTCEEFTYTNLSQTVFEWRRGVLELSESSFLSIPYMTPDLTGDYTCTAYACPPLNASVSVTVNVSDPDILITQLPNASHPVGITWPPHPTARQHVVESRVGDNQLWSRVANTSQLFYAPQNLQFAINYTFRVSYFKEAEKIQISTSSTFQLDLAPTILFAISLSPTQLLIRWMWDGELSSLEYFVVRYQLVGRVSSNQTAHVSQLDTSVGYFERAISGLKPNSEYNVIVFGIKKVQDSWNTPYSLLKTVFIPPYILTASPPHLTVSYLPSTNSFSISYSLLSNVTAEYGELLGYKILVYLEDDPYNGVFYIHSPSRNSLNLTLPTGVEYYSVQVLAFTIAGDGPATGQYFFLPNSSRISSTTVPTNSNATLPSATTAAVTGTSSRATDTVRLINTAAGTVSIADTTGSFTAYRMTAPPTNASQPGAPQSLIAPYLPYIIAIPSAFCLACAVILIVLVGKCFHLHYWKSVRDEADDYRMRRYETHITKLKKNPSNNNTLNVKLQSVIKSASPTHPHPHRTDIPLEPRRMRTYQVPLTREEPTHFHLSNDSFSPVDQTSGRPLTPDSGKVLDTFSDDIGANSAEYPEPEKVNPSFSFQSNLDCNVPYMTGAALFQDKTSGNDAKQSPRIHEFSV